MSSHYWQKGIGLILAAIAVITYFNTVPDSSSILQIIVLLAAGLVLLFTPKKSAVKNLELLTASLHFDRRYVLQLVYDAVYYGILFALYYSFAKIAEKAALAIPGVQTAPEALAQEVILEANIGILQGFIAKMAVYTLIFVILALLLYSLSRWLIWHTIANKKPINFKKFLLTTAMLWSIFILPLIFAFLGLKQDWIPIALFILILLYIHLAGITHYAFTKGNTPRECIKTAFTRGFAGFGTFLQPYAYAITIYLILTLVATLIASPATMSMVILLLIVLFMAWFRLMLSRLLAKSL